MYLHFLYLVIGYVAGSIPFGYIVAKLWKNVDIRKYGSGNIGATNVYRVIGGLPASIVLICDIGKGLLPVLLVQKIFFSSSSIFIISIGITTIIGHNYSIFLKGKGGKGVATSFGVILGLFPAAAGSAFLIWLIVFLTTRYVSVSSISGTLALPFFIYFYQKDWVLTIFGIIISFLIIYQHRENLKRLKSGKENKMKFPWKKK